MKILSQGKFREFSHVAEMGTKEICEVVFNDNSKVQCTPDHQFLTKDGWKQAQEFSKDEDLFAKSVKDVIYRGEKQPVYDVIDVKDTHSFTVNDIEAHNCLVIDEAAFVPGWEEFWTSVFPTISSGTSTKVILTSTPNAMNDFYYLFSDAVAGDNGFAYTFFDWRAHPNRDEEWAKTMKSKLGERRFDQEFNCKFFGSTGTLIDGDSLEYLAANKKPHIQEKYDGHFRMHEAPIKDAHYVAIADTAEGLGADSSALTIVKISSLRPKVVAYYKNNKIEIEPYAEVCNALGRYYNEALMLVENNSIGRLTVSKLWDTLFYPNMLRTSTDDRETKVNGKGSKPGVRTTMLTKAIGCSTLKSMIEAKELIVEQPTIINELSTFVQKGRSFEAMSGRNDDLVMTLVLFAWLTTTQWYFSYRNSIVDFTEEPEGDLEVLQHDA